MESSLLSKRENAGYFFDAGKDLLMNCILALFALIFCSTIVVVESVCHF